MKTASEPARRQRAGGELGGLARSDQEDPPRGEIAEVPLGELDRDRWDRDALLPDRGLGPDALARREGAAEDPVQDRTAGALDQRQLVGPLHLALDLGLAEDHRVEARRDPVEMSRGVGVAQRVERAEQLGRRDPGLPGEDAEARGLSLDRVGGYEVELGAVARGKRERLADRLLRDERVQHSGSTTFGESELLAQSQRRGVVRDTQDQEAAHRAASSRCVSSRTDSISSSRSR